MKSRAEFTKSMGYRIGSRLLGGLVILWVSILASPRLLAFPHQADVGDVSVYSETPITPHINAIVGRSRALLKNSAIYSPDYGKTIYLTNGGWRWNLLAAPTSRNGFALSRPLVKTIVINQSDLASDKVFSAAANGRSRTLSGTIAHEQTHHLLHNFLGLRVIFAPTWKIEGYCDHVAQNGSLDDVQATALARAQPDHPALVYYHGRKRAAAMLARNGGSVEQLFEE